MVMMNRASGWKKCLVGFLLVSAAALATVSVDAASPQDKVLIKIHEQNPDAKTTSFNLETNEVKIAPSDGFVEIFRGDSVLRAKQMTYGQKSQKAVLTGDVSASQPDFDLQANTLAANFTDDEYVAEGNVKFQQWELTESKERKDQKLKLTANKVATQNDSDTLQAEGQVYVEESTRRVWADQMEYDGEKELMVFSGGVVLETEEGSRMTGEKLAVDLESDEATVFGPVEFEFVLESDK